METRGCIIFPVNVAVTGCNANVQQEMALNLEYQSPAKPLHDISLFSLSPTSARLILVQLHTLKVLLESM